MTGKDNEISIWFFIGISLLVNGVLIAAAGAYEFIKPPAKAVVLQEYHASFWWGLVLLIAGLFYCIRFRPTAQKREASAEKLEEIHVH